jgi:hypothetical protein
MSRAHQNSILPVQDMIQAADDNTTEIFHYDISPNGVNGMKPVDDIYDDSLICWLEMQNQNSAGTYVVDKSRYGNHGKINGATSADGRNGKALQFGLADQHVLPLMDPSMIDSNNFSVSAWVYPTSLTGYWMIFGKQEPDSRIYIGSNNDSLWDIGVGTSGWGATVTGTKPSVVVNQWTHVALTLNSGTVSFYLNGSFCFSKTYTAFTSNYMFYIGGHNNIGSAPVYEFQGRIDSFMIFKNTTYLFYII